MFSLKSLNIFKKQKVKTTEKLSLAEVVWFGFNYIVGVSFTAVFASLLYSDVGVNLGTHMIWIFLVEGLIAGTCAWAFARLSQVHPGNNGAAYIYTRSAYGRFWGWIIAFIQYSTLPVIITAQIIATIRINFTNPEIGILYANWGVWTNFGLDLIGILVYVAVSSILFLGMKAFRNFVNISGYIKWATTFLLIIAVIVLFIMAGTSNYQNMIEHQSLTAGSFSKAFTSCFFFFLGFETYSTIGKNIQNPQKNISRSVLIVMTLATLFYVLVTVLMIGAVAGSFSDNPNLQVFSILGKKLNAQWLGNIGAIIMAICTISLKANSQIQNALYGAGILEPLAVEGYIPTKYKETIKDDKLPYRAIKLNVVISLIFSFIWLLLPDLIQVITDSARGLKEPSRVIDFSTATGEVSLIMIIIYIFVISIALKLSWQKKIKHNKFEFVIWTIALLFLVWQLVMWFVNLAESFASSLAKINSNQADLNSAGITMLISNIIQIFYLVATLIFGVCWYCLYYQPKLQVRLLNQTQAKFDQEFLLQDDWPFVAKNLQIEVENYLHRNLIINGDKKNKNYQFAQKIRKELVASEGDWKEED